METKIKKLSCRKSIIQFENENYSFYNDGSKKNLEPVKDLTVDLTVWMQEKEGWISLGNHFDLESAYSSTFLFLDCSIGL